MTITALEMAAKIEARLAEITASVTAGSDWSSRHREAEMFAVELACEYGAYYRDGRTINAHRFRYAGIACTCTSGTIGLLRAWVTKARKAATA